MPIGEGARIRGKGVFLFEHKHLGWIYACTGYYMDAWR